MSNEHVWNYSIANAVYDKGDALVQDKQTDVKLDRVGEAVLIDGKWKANDEMVTMIM